MSQRAKKGLDVVQDDYIPLVGDPCYLYNRLSKETFLKNASCSFLFLLAEDFIRQELPLTKNFDSQNSNAAYEELLHMARATFSQAPNTL